MSVLHLPDDSMKGRIIGREGRNIRTFEAVTGVNLLIDDTPEAVLLSSFDPVRREVARITLEALVADGRIQPSRIEEEYERSRLEVDAASSAPARTRSSTSAIGDMHPDLIALLGRLRYRTSYGQNVLGHLVECAHLAGIMAAELRLPIEHAKRCALLHDVGKALTHEVQGSHALIGGEVARRYGEHEDVVHAIEAHHNEVEVRTLEAVLTQTADSMSGGRPGARRESLEHYVERLERLEQIASAHAGVDKVFAMQAGREVRIVVLPDAGRRHRHAGPRPRHRRRDRARAHLPRPDPRHRRARVPSHRPRPLTRRSATEGDLRVLYERNAIRHFITAYADERPATTAESRTRRSDASRRRLMRRVSPRCVVVVVLGGPRRTRLAAAARPRPAASTRASTAGRCTTPGPSRVSDVLQTIGSFRFSVWVVAATTVVLLLVARRWWQALTLVLLAALAPLITTSSSRSSAAPGRSGTSRSRRATFVLPVRPRHRRASRSTPRAASPSASLLRNRIAGRSSSSLRVLVVGIAIGLSRLVLGVHWPSDVVGGWCVALAVAGLAAARCSSCRRHQQHSSRRREAAALSRTPARPERRAAAAARAHGRLAWRS